MSEPKIARDAAELELDLWCEALEHQPAEGDREKLLSVIMAGRITFDDKAEAFTYRLRIPLELENKTMLSAVKVSDITARQFADAYKSIKVSTGAEKQASVSMDCVLNQLSAATGLAYGIVERIKNRDFTLLQALMGFFE